MVQVNVGQENMTNVIPPYAVLLQAQVKRAEAAGWTGIDDGDTGGAAHDTRGDDIGPPLKLQIDPRKSMTQCVHGIEGLY